MIWVTHVLLHVRSLAHNLVGYPLPDKNARDFFQFNARYGKEHMKGCIRSFLAALFEAAVSVTREKCGESRPMKEREFATWWRKYLRTPKSREDFYAGAIKKVS